MDKPAIVIELKYNKSADGAIMQIKEKRYAKSLRDYVGEIVLVGINYDKRTKQHSCVIERISDKTSDKFPINRKVSDKTSDKLRKIIVFMKETGGIITQVEVASMFNISDRQARNYLDALVKQNHIIRLGANKDRKYKLKQ